MDAKTVALAAFVKTPSLSPVKTRLAQHIGAPLATAIYEESVKQTAATLSTAMAQNPSLQVHWAVGEQTALTHRRWQQFPTLWTGDGSLGHRLHHIYTTLKQTYKTVILIGTDAPQMPVSAIASCITTPHAITIGPARDGGFYLFASHLTISLNQWTTPTYSQPATLSQLLAALPATPINTLPSLTDIDDPISLQHCLDEWQNHPHSHPLHQLHQQAKST